LKRNKKTRRYCPFCKKHTEQTVSIAKKRDRGTLKHGSIARAKKRGRGRGYGNVGRWGSKPTKPKRMGKKSSKKHDLRYKCSACNKMSVQAYGRRAKKLELK
jgi:large subunit ribosomal protein L44e